MLVASKVFIHGTSKKIYKNILFLSFGLILWLNSFNNYQDMVQVEESKETKVKYVNLRQQNKVEKESDLNKILQYEACGPKKEAYRRSKVKEMMKHAWGNYKKYAWGHNELRPISKTGYDGNKFSKNSIGETIIDAIDTLYIMNMVEEYNEAQYWIAKNFTLEDAVGDLSVFEINIRIIGSFLSMYSLTGEVMYKEKAVYTANKLLPAFDTPTGIPYALINLKNNKTKNYEWASGSSSILSEVGGFSLEFTYLSDITSNPIYQNKIQQIQEFLFNLEKRKGLYPNYIDPVTGEWGLHYVSIGAYGDSFYEYLLKSWQLSNQDKNDKNKMFVDAINSVIKHLVQQSHSGFTYVSERRFSELEHKMDHLSGYLPGILALAAYNLNNSLSNSYLELAESLLSTFHEAYSRSATQLGPEWMYFVDGYEAKSMGRPNENYYALRPEVVESYFILWRITHNNKYREWAWEVIQALEKFCRTPNGYSGILDVYSTNPMYDDIQQSYFLAETLKYLYLIFTDDSIFSINEWVFNTEAHPLPIKNVNKFYRSEIK